METVWRVKIFWKLYGKISLEIVWGFHGENMVNQTTRQSPYHVSVNSNWIHASPPWATPWKIFLSELIPATRAILLSNSLPREKNDGRIPQGLGKIFPNSKKLLRIKLAKVLKKLRRLRDSKTTRKSLNTPASIFS